MKKYSNFKVGQDAMPYLRREKEKTFGRKIRDGAITLAAIVAIGSGAGYLLGKTDPYNKEVEKIYNAPTIEAYVPGDEVWGRFQREDILHGQPTYHEFLREIKKRNEGNMVFYNNCMDVFDFKSQPINWPDVDGDGQAGKKRE